MSRTSVAVMVLSVAGLGTWVGGAQAQQCSDDTGCPKGFQCEVTGVSSTCSGSAPVFPTPSCPEGQKCELPASMPLPPANCVTMEYRSCVPNDCVSDSDCASGMVCHAQTDDCTSAGPAPDEAVCKDGICPPREPPPPDCKVKQQCVPRYVLPCEQASDCGEGFTCEAQKRCGCSAGTAAAEPSPAPQPGDAPASADAGAPADFRAPAPPPDCTCEVTPEKYCKAVEVVCRADSDCPGDFTCQGAVFSSGGSGGSSGGVPACDPQPGVDGGCGAALPTPPQPIVVEERRCVPPYGDVGVDASGGSLGEGVPTRAGGVKMSPTAPPSALPSADSAGKHSRACSAVGPGRHETGGLALWASLLTLAAAVLVSRRRR